MSHQSVELTPKTKKGRERIKQHGSSGKVIRSANKVLFSTEQGPWLLVTAADPVSRWVHQTRDPDFNVILK